MKAIRLYKHIAFCGLTAVTLTLAVATLVEKYYGTEFVRTHIYTSPWMIVLWGSAAHFGLFYLLRLKLYRRMATFLIHAALLLILAGAFITHRHGKQGRIHLRTGGQVTHFTVDKDKDEALPFALELESFELKCHEGSLAPMDYISHLRIRDGEKEIVASVSMNRIFSYRGHRLYQSGYDEDGKGSVLSVNYDPWGIGITYSGYALLFIAMCAFFFDRSSHFRKLLKHPLLHKRGKRGMAILLLIPSLAAHAQSETLSSKTAEAFGKMCVYYNDRICPMQTVAYDFTLKVYGKSAYKGLSPEQVLSGWFFHYDSWKNEPFIHIKEESIRKILGIDGEYACLTDFTSFEGYKLQHALASEDATLRRAAEKNNEKFNLVSMLCTGSLLKIYPIHEADSTVLRWYALTDRLPENLPYDHWLFIKQSMNLVAEKVIQQNDSAIIGLLGKISLYQRKVVAEAMPSEQKLQAERLYNRCSLQPGISVVTMTFGILYFLLFVTLPQIAVRYRCGITAVCFAVLMLVWLSLRIVLRWYIGGNVPLTNGHETLEFMAWGALVTLLLAGHRMHILRPAGLLMCGVAMLVSWMGQKSPQITPLIPVLHSPLLSIHVAAIMLAYCLLAFSMCCAVAAFIARLCRKGNPDETEYLYVVSNLMLYPAVFLLAAGIFIGAVWANISWGRYWGWDPKEVWALITMLIYAAPLHCRSIPFFRNHIRYHAYILAAFLAVVMTYFGVNFLLGGMHSYA